MLARVLDLTEMEVDQAADPQQALDWSTLPERAIVPMHWLPDANFRALLAAQDFRPVVIARHPLDVLLSILAFSQHDESTLRWLAGAGGDERSIQGASPMSDTFLSYACGARATALLSVSAQWWQTPGACHVHYHDLIRDTAGQIEQLLGALGVSARRPLAEVIEKSSPEAMRAKQVEWLYHIWQRQPGSWKRLLTPASAQRICDAHASVMACYDYLCDADESLDTSAAQAAWEQIEAAAVKRNVNGVKKILAQINARQRQDRAQIGADLHSHAAQLQQIGALTAALQEVKREHERDLQQHRAELATLTRQFESLPLEQIRELGELGPWSFAFARRMQHWSQRFPRVASAAKALVTAARAVNVHLQ